jgi:hypothetical protein
VPLPLTNILSNLKASAVSPNLPQFQVIQPSQQRASLKKAGNSFEKIGVLEKVQIKTPTGGE